MSDRNDSATLAYVKYVLEELSISPTALAKKVGISSTTLTRPLNNSDYKFNLSATTIEKIASFSGISPGPFFHKTDIISMKLGAGHPVDESGPDEPASLPVGKSTAVVGEVMLGSWREISVTDYPTEHWVEIKSTRYKSEDCFLLRVGDRQGGLFAYLGDYIFCVRYEAYCRDVLNGEYVIIERRQENSRFVELTLRRTQRVKAGWQFTTMASDSNLQHQVVLTDLPGDETAKVVGVVLCAIRQPH